MKLLKRVLSDSISKMPVHHACFRVRCGAFASTLIQFMAKRERLARLLRCAVITVRNKLDLAFFFSVTCYLLSFGCGELKPVSSGYACLKLKTKTLHSDPVNGNSAGTRVAFDPNTLLLRAGDVEQNPGPGEGDSGSNERRQNQQQAMDSARVLEALSESVQSLTGVVRRLEEGQQQLSLSVNQQLGGLQHTLDSKLGQLAGDQEVLRLDLDELCSRQERVEDDTAMLKHTVQQLADALEAEKRKFNLLFWGIGKQTDSTCEELVKQTLRDQLHISSDVLIEYALWTGNAILARFQSMKQRALVLTRAKQLSADSKLSIREDFSKEVSARRKGLMALYRQLRNDGHRATLRADRLYTNGGVFTYDLQRREIVRLNLPPSRRQHNVTVGGGAGGPGHDAAASALANTSNGNGFNGNAEGMEGVVNHDVAVSTGGGVGGPRASDRQQPPNGGVMPPTLHKEQRAEAALHHHPAAVGGAPGGKQRMSLGVGRRSTSSRGGRQLSALEMWQRPAQRGSEGLAVAARGDQPAAEPPATQHEPQRPPRTWRNGSNSPQLQSPPGASSSRTHTSTPSHQHTHTPLHSEKNME